MKPRHLRLASMVILGLATFHPTTRAAALDATSSIDPRIRLDWEVGAGHGGRPVIQGYVYNDYLRAASDVRLLVETLDASGTMIARDLGFVRGVVAFGGRNYFEIPLKTPGASYRVRVTGLDWKDSGGGSGSM